MSTGEMATVGSPQAAPATNLAAQLSDWADDDSKPRNAFSAHQTFRLFNYSAAPIVADHCPFASRTRGAIHWAIAFAEIAHPCKRVVG